MKQHQVILENSFPVFVERVIALTKDGWEVDPNMIPVTFLASYECGMTRSPTSEQLEKDGIEANKPTVADKMAKARAAKAEKAKEKTVDA